MIIGYVRVGANDQSLNLQLDALTTADCVEILEEQATGKNMARPKLQMLFEIIQPGDKVVVWRVDRIAKNTKHLIEIIKYFINKKVGFMSVMDGIDTDTSEGKMFLHTMDCLAVFEDEIAKENSAAGLNIARSRGKNGGRPKKPKKVIENALALYDSKEHTINDICAECGISNATLYRYIQNRSKS